MKNSDFVKIQVFCPRNVADKVRLSIGESGGGCIGNYHYCAFVSSGHGYFLPMEGSNPAIGKQGEISQTEEVKIEFVCKQDKVKDIISAVKKVHPYEEVLIDIFELLDFEG